MKSHKKDLVVKFPKHWPSLRKYLVSKVSCLSFAGSLIESIYMLVGIYIS